MDRLQGQDVAREEEYFDPFDDAAIDAPLPVASQDRRMHMRALDYWTSLLGGRDFPSIEDLSPELLKEFSPYCLLLDISQSSDDPVIAYLGSALQADCPSAQAIMQMSDVPPRSLLSRLTGPYRQVLEGRSPVAFESEFLNERGAQILYRGLLMPFSSDRCGIDHMLGVISWKEQATVEESEAIEREMREAMDYAAKP